MMRYELPTKKTAYVVNWFFSGKTLMTVEKVSPDIYAAIVKDNGVITYTDQHAKDDPVIEELLYKKP